MSTEPTIDEAVREAVKYAAACAAQAGIQLEVTRTHHDVAKGRLWMDSDAISITLNYSGEEDDWSVTRTDSHVRIGGDSLQEQFEILAEDVREEIQYLKETFLL